MKVMDPEDILATQLAALKAEHRALDDEILAAAADPLCDQIALRQRKKRKLSLKDAIARIEDQLYPDIIA
ncbi:MAG: YdcH family protein [Pseudomonadota bacterium]